VVLISDIAFWYGAYEALSSALAVASVRPMPECILSSMTIPNIRNTRDAPGAGNQYKVCGEAVDGLDGIDKARQLHPDLIILDMSMPRMNGCKPREY